ncbi:Clp protease N-terminal domain-containing protein [Microbispora siamensis]|uniref:ATP-dependent Clp protease n=1 Tax=Microbispora siamensis TaxID=564413 RepID=A0ABQ4GPI1_9ACTN|nr:Clp protease N-terminal domain-containing protein [Microbispora siamensis]GIH63254.1 putative ATP-dependent Clp protease [Microbispora siamensis]
MFERFTDDARQVVKHAVEQARELRHEQAGTEHILLGLLTPQTPSARLLAAHGIDHAGVRAEIVRIRGDLTGEGIDAEALESIGIDLSAVREKVEGVFGPGALDRAPQRDRRGVLVSGWRVPFGPRARKVLELSLREALAMKSRSIRDGHILLGVIREGEGLGVRILTDAGIDLSELREEVKSGL